MQAISTGCFLIIPPFLADRTAASSMIGHIGYWHDTVVCLSVCPSDPYFGHAPRSLEGMNSMFLVFYNKNTYFSIFGCWLLPEKIAIARKNCFA